MRTALITGCSSGIGRSLVPAFLEAGFAVLATARDPAAYDGEPARALTLARLDLTSPADREALAGLVGERCPAGLDVLVNNAGSGVLGALEDLSEEQIREQFEVNVFGTILLTRALLSSLRRARGRIISISSLIGEMGAPLASAYCASKFALEGFMESLAYELAPHGVQVALVEPGAHRTGFEERVRWGVRSFDPRSPYAAATGAYRDMRLRRQADGSRPAGDAVAAAVVRLARRGRMPLRTRCGRDAKAARALRALLPEAVLHPLAARLFAMQSRKRD